MQHFIKKHDRDIIGVLSGWDRIRFRGTIRMLAYANGLLGWLCDQRVLLKEFKTYSLSLTASLKQSVSAVAEAAGKTVKYLSSSSLSKEDLVQELLRREEIADGLVCVLRCVEPCQSVDIYRNRETKHIDLVPALRKCLHFYLYFLDPVLGLCHVRIQSWLPFTVHVCVNGREWLCRQLQQAGIGFTRSDNCLIDVADISAAQKLYPSLLRHAMTTFSSREVMRFLGRTRLPAAGGVDVRFNGQVVTDLRQRPEGIRIKHRMNRNSIKMYDKQGSVLRVETTINDAHDLSAYRASESDPKGPKKWQRLRKGVVDLPRRAEISQATNSRYLTALSEADATTPLGKLADAVRNPVMRQGRRFRGLNPLSGPDAQLAEILLRGEFTLKGFRNRDVRELLCPATISKTERRRQSARVSRLLRLFREHGLIRKLKGTLRYQLTATGRRTLPAFIAARNANAQQLQRLAA